MALIVVRLFVEHWILLYLFLSLVHESSHLILYRYLMIYNRYVSIITYIYASSAVTVYLMSKVIFYLNQ